MTNSHLTPHDKYFRALMTNLKVAQEFFEQNLPTYIKSVINFATIKLQKESFIDDKLRLQVVDMLYSAEFNHEPGYLYLLVEQQSTPDKLMAFRVLKYMVAIMEHHVKQTATDKLPIVYPIIFYTGNKSYNYSTDLFDLFGSKKELAKDILWQPYRLIDLSKVPDEKLKQFLRYGVLARIMKHIYQKDFLPILKGLLNDLREIEIKGEKDYIYTVLSYIIEAGDLERQEFIDTVKTGLKVNEDQIMTLAEQFRQEGLQKGLQQGLQQGKLEGLQQGKLEGRQEGERKALTDIALKLFTQKMSIAQIASVTGLSPREIEELKSNLSSLH